MTERRHHELLARSYSWFSRPAAPTRRIALGEPGHCEGSPRHVVTLLAGIMSSAARRVSSDDLARVATCLELLHNTDSITQPNLRHRLQVDRIGLLRIEYRLERIHETYRWVFARRQATPLQHVLGATYMASALPKELRREALHSLDRALEWTGELDDSFVRFLATQSLDSSSPSPMSHRWALEVLRLNDHQPQGLGRSEIQRAFRAGLLAVHPDQGGDHSSAARRISELSDARRILLAAS